MRRWSRLPSRGPRPHYAETMSTGSERVYVARLVNTPVFDPIGDSVGRVRDVVVLMRQGRDALRRGPRR